MNAREWGIRCLIVVLLLDAVTIAIAGARTWWAPVAAGGLLWAASRTLEAE